MHPESPLRAKARSGNLGQPRGASAAGTYRDGGEERVLSIIRQAKDLSSLSDELQQQAATWAESYHLSTDRANVLRPLILNSEDRVLEVGAGCGAITRYVGERCALVDGIEPDVRRAQVAHARVQDLATAEIFATNLDDVPEVPFYDVALVVGVLEYVGLGAADRAPYLEFLEKIRSRLAPGGVVICAIENLLGVKYLCGSPEDHTGWPFDGLTGYRRGGKARTFSRPQLTEFFEAAGLSPVFLHVFPDYKMTRAVLTDRTMTPEYEMLAREIPEFPSPDRVPGHARVADEYDAWQALVEAREASSHANSFLVIGMTQGSPSRWPAERLAAFYAQRRAAPFRTETLVEDGAPLQFVRRRLSDGSPRVGTLCHEVASSELIEGILLSEALESADAAERHDYLVRWRDLVFASPGMLDLIPKNIRVSSSGTLIPFDQEWRDDSVLPVDVLARGVLSLYDRLGPGWLRELPVETPVSERATVARFGEQVGLPSDGSWIDTAIESEAVLTATVATGGTSGDAWLRAYAATRAAFLEKFPSPVVELRPPSLQRRIWRRGSRALRVLVKGY